MKKTLLLLLTLLSATAVTACPLCNKDIMNGIYNSAFYPNLAIMLSRIYCSGCNHFCAFNCIGNNA